MASGRLLVLAVLFCTFCCCLGGSSCAGGPAPLELDAIRRDALLQVLNNGTFFVANSSCPAVVQPGTDHPSDDFNYFTLDTPDYNICYNACCANDRCVSWTYVDPGYQGPLAGCYLKAAVSPGDYLPNVTSGLLTAQPGQPPFFYHNLTARISVQLTDASQNASVMTFTRMLFYVNDTQQYATYDAYVDGTVVVTVYRYDTGKKYVIVEGAGETKDGSSVMDAKSAASAAFPCTVSNLTGPMFGPNAFESMVHSGTGVLMDQNVDIYVGPLSVPGFEGTGNSILFAPITPWRVKSVQRIVTSAAVYDWLSSEWGGAFPNKFTDPLIFCPEA